MISNTDISAEKTSPAPGSGGPTCYTPRTKPQMKTTGHRKSQSPIIDEP